jgi:hypothetical protein
VNGSALGHHPGRKLNLIRRGFAWKGYFHKYSRIDSEHERNTAKVPMCELNGMQELMKTTKEIRWDKSYKPC